MPLILSGATSGTVTIDTPAVAGSNTLTVPAATGTVLTSVSPASDLPSSIKGPAFSAYLASNTSFTVSTWTKVPCSTEEFDTNNNYDNSTNYRFTPTVAGYYQINGRWDCTVAATIVLATIYKNGSEFKRGVDIRATLSGATGASVSALIYMNGTTDYVELYGYAANATSPQFEGGQMTAYFQGYLARAA